ncbi:MAG: LacI family DNA-binding transcriptional regulator [Chloroflexota bacterium]
MSAARRGGDRTGPPTIQDVALRAGVSTATVSRLLAGIGTPRPGTAAAVLRAVEELGYRPSGVARSLRIRRTGTLGLIVTDIQNPFFPELVQAADQAARANGCSILLGSAAYDEHRAMHYLDLMVERRVDGLIIASSQVSEASWDWLIRSPVPIVVVNAEPAGRPVMVVTSDNAGAMGLAVRHLVDLGHRRIAFVRGPLGDPPSEARLTGFREACEGAGLDPAATPVLDGDARFEGGVGAVERLLADGAPVTAVVAHNDLTAIGAIHALRAAGHEVPRDVSVVGCDDIAAASWVSPPLTTLGQVKAEMGRLAVERLIAAIGAGETRVAPETIRLPMTLVVRGTTGPAAATA